MLQAGGTVFIPAITFDVGISAYQTRFQLDRGARFAFVLAVEDCVRGVTTAATRERGEQFTNLLPLHVAGAEGRADVLINGSIMSLWLKGFLISETDWEKANAGTQLTSDRVSVLGLVFPGKIMLIAIVLRQTETGITRNSQR
jgi:hypothetical protein